MRNEGLGSWPHRRARISAEDTALIHDDRHWSYGEVRERVSRLAGGLHRVGVARGTRVAYLGPNHPAFVETMFAAGQLGAVFVPLNSRLAAAELGTILRDAEPDVLVVAPDLAGTAEDALAGAPVRHRFVVGDRPAASMEALEPLIAQSSPGDAPDVPVVLDDLAMLMYTSGTTGEPKGVALTHANLTWNCFNVLIDVDVSQDEVTLVSAPLFHTAALNQTFLPTFVKGGTSVLVSAFDPDETLELIERHRISWMFGVPAMFQALAQSPKWESADLSSIRAVEAGGAPVPEDLIRTYQARGMTFMQGYGMTEAAPGVSFLRAKDSLSKVGSAGAPCFFSDVDVVDDNGCSVPEGRPGEVVVRGPNVMRGYWGKPDATAAVMSDDGWFHSGDLAERDEDGYLYIVDRVKDMFISGGENIYPAEIENALHEHAAVADCAVIGVPDERWGETGRAFVVPHHGQHLTEEEMRGFLEQRLARYKIPKSLVLVDELPRSASGKLLKKELRTD
ncbi:long-chain-fatty-acid--CoA ligase [Egibacter rhizosphaerae]|uniref:Long-chain-fatty-acid--CoA ligase n=1 Tax=Egibacter rhizosphaerae TaxID=1670831 RepID=A0A411YE29_9ACTN|nr:long-chain fatty acid--CoA ligase [Egibacter rhizosphaerae]QBI19402.1 long-chain-fatty-acid--CoA ligase [Egibacter rhizosphaerae]